MQKDVGLDSASGMMLILMISKYFPSLNVADSKLFQLCDLTDCMNPVQIAYCWHYMLDYLWMPSFGCIHRDFSEGLWTRGLELGCRGLGLDLTTSLNIPSNILLFRPNVQWWLLISDSLLFDFQAEKEPARHQFSAFAVTVDVSSTQQRKRSSWKAAVWL